MGLKTPSNKADRQRWPLRTTVCNEGGRENRHGAQTLSNWNFAILLQSWAKLQGRKVERRAGSVLTCFFSANPPHPLNPPYFQFLQRVYVQIWVAASAGVGREGVIWSWRFFFSFLFFSLHCAIKFNDTSACLNRLKWLGFALAK